MDPYLNIEKKKYKNPIPSRAYILDTLKSQPLSSTELYQKLKINDIDKNAFQLRIKAMLHDGQIFINKKKQYGAVSETGLVKGQVKTTKKGAGFVITENGKEDIYLDYRQMHSIFSGDEVLVLSSINPKNKKVKGTVVDIINRKYHELIGILTLKQGNGWLEPFDKNVHHPIFIPKDKLNQAKNLDTVKVKIVEYPSKHTTTTAKVIEIYKHANILQTQIQITNDKYNIPYTWNKEILQELKEIDDSIQLESPLATSIKRIDLRDKAFITIDGSDSKDFDDAVFAEPKESGGFTLIIAIADVANYVLVNSALNKEAHLRGNSVYYPNYVIPMLPEKLSNELCSLNPQTDRYVLACSINLDSNGELQDYQFYPALLNSHARLTYKQVSKYFNSCDKKDLLTMPDNICKDKLNAVIHNLKYLLKTYYFLEQQRHARHALDFDIPTTEFIFSKDSKLIKIKTSARNLAHKLIEEIMLLANVCAAKFVNKYMDTGIYRIHPEPKLEVMQEVLNFFATSGYKVQSLQQKIAKHGKIEVEDFAILQEKVADSPSKDLFIQEMLRGQMQASYSTKNIGHYGLNYKIYTHFTSPIRRYADLITHRKIYSILESQTNNKITKKIKQKYDQKLEEICQHISNTDRRAEDASRNIAAFIKCDFLLDKIGMSFDGLIVGVTNFGIFVNLKKFNITGLVHISDLGKEYFIFDSNQQSLKTKKSNKIFKIGQQLRVKIIRAQPETQKIDFALD